MNNAVAKGPDRKSGARNHRGRFHYLWPAILWAIIIFFFSTSFFTAANTSRIIVPLLHFLFPSASNSTIAEMHHLIRKCGHVTNYFIFSILLFRSVRGDDRGWKWRWALWAVLLAAAYAGTDEFHQIYVPGRTPSLWDVLIDTCGAMLAQIGVFLKCRRAA